jgi:hypothetical protein
VPIGATRNHRHSHNDYGDNMVYRRFFLHLDIITQENLFYCILLDST